MLFHCYILIESHPIDIFYQKNKTVSGSTSQRLYLLISVLGRRNLYVRIENGGVRYH